MRQSTLLVLSFWSCSVCSWVKPLSKRALLAETLQYRNNSRLFSTEPSVPDLKGKTVYQRVFYRFSHGSEVDIHDAMVVEERCRFQPDPDRLEEGYVKPMGPRTLILRDGQVEEGEIGDEFFTINVHEERKTHNGAGIDLKIEATIATAMYLASNPSLCTGDVLEVASNLGLASLLGCIGAGFVTKRSKASEGEMKGEDVADEILTVPKEGGLLPEGLNMLTITEASDEQTNYVFHNVKDSGVAASQVAVEELDWTVRNVQPRIRKKGSKEYNSIVTSDVAFTYPEAKELARNVANKLKPSGWFLGADNPESVPRFVHICPDAREDVVYLRQFFEKGYRMSTSTGYLKLEKLRFNFQYLPESEDEQALDDLELELQEFKEIIYQSLTAQHHPDYAGEGSGEIFFPMETGEYEAAGGKSSLEPEGGMNPFI